MKIKPVLVVLLLGAGSTNAVLPALPGERETVAAAAEAQQSATDAQICDWIAKLHGDYSERQGAVYQLSQLKVAQSKRALPAIIDLLSSEDWHKQCWAAKLATH